MLCKLNLLNLMLYIHALKKVLLILKLQLIVPHIDWHFDIYFRPLKALNVTCDINDVDGDKT